MTCRISSHEGSCFKHKKSENHLSSTGEETKCEMCKNCIIPPNL